MPTTTTDLIEVAVTAAQEKLASDPVLVDVAERLAIAGSFLILSAPSERQVRAIAEEILDRVKAECGVEAERIEGRTGNRWILIDYGTGPSRIWGSLARIRWCFHEWREAHRPRPSWSDGLQS